MENKVIAVQFGSKNKSAGKASVQATPPTQDSQGIGFSQSIPVNSGINSSVLSNTEADVEPKEDLRTLAERNRANQERLRKERELANKAVLKSYRIK